MKKNLFLNVLIGIAVVIVIFVIIVSLRPADFSVTRTSTISASPATVFEQVNDLHKWQAWSPWVKVDPNAKIVYSGPVAGVGSSFDWSGNMDIGEGRMTITESQPGERVQFKLEFRKPLAGVSMAEFTFKPENNQTLVTWNMSGKNNFMGKLIGLFMDCDKMIGSQFEKGLADLKSISEAANKK